ncbi:sulfatase-like hydrolase/transferase [Pseudomonas sp. NPDC086581]|uniref:sulfatase-like hydrolase/transferase n=1 Tax=Pseudomonas sp. NPDC086581 TaxID=3364432 RepID=UPI0037FCF797
MHNNKQRKTRPVFLALILIPLTLLGVLSEPQAIYHLAVGMLSIVALFSALGIFLIGSRKAPSLLRVPLLLACTASLSVAVLTAISLSASYIKFGGLPSPEVMAFVRHNLELIPAHVLQTAPLLSITSVLISSAAAFFIMSRMKQRLAKVTNFHTAQAVVIGAATLSLALAMIRYYPWSASEPAAPLLNPAVTNYLERLPSRVVSSAIKPERKYPVVVILVESLRHDLLTTYAQDIPFLQKLANENVTFNRAYATASHSNLTDLAFWYSQYPLRGPGKESYPIDAPWRGDSLFGAFKDAGYGTAYISSQNERWGEMINWLDTPDLDYFFHSENFGGSTWENHDDKPGLASLIKRGITTAGKVEDSQTLEIARDWIRDYTDGRAFFLGMNLQNTHYSYVIPAGGIEPHQPANLGFQAIYYSWPKEKAAQVRNRYLNAVTNVDRLLADFAEDLQRKGLWDECLLVVLGDNGEGFYEHGFGNHSGPMYDEAVRTLAIIKTPKSLHIPAQQIDKPISHIDLAATVAQLAGIEAPDSFQGRPVLNAPLPNRPVLMYSNAMVRQFGVVDWPWKYLATEHPVKKEELYNLSQDEAEMLDLAPASPDILRKMRATGDFWRESQQRYYSDSRYRVQRPPAFDRADLLISKTVNPTQ